LEQPVTVVATTAITARTARWCSQRIRPPIVADRAETGRRSLSVYSCRQPWSSLVQSPQLDMLPPMSITVIITRDDNGAPMTREVYEEGAKFTVENGELNVISARPQLVALYGSGNWLSVHLDDHVAVVTAAPAEDDSESDSEDDSGSDDTDSISSGESDSLGTDGDSDTGSDESNTATDDSAVESL
jgi:hypothetical protein